MTRSSPRATTAPARASTNLIFLVLLAGVAAYGVLQSLVSPVLPTIQHALHTTQNTVTWVLTSYLLSASVFTPILGRMGDVLGKKRMLVVALMALALGSLLAAVATSIGIMIVARSIQGIGGASLPLVFGIIRDEFPPEKVAGAVGRAAAVVAAGAGFGIVLAGPIVDALSYHWLFWIPMILVSAAAVATEIWIPESLVRGGAKVGYLGGLLLSVWLIALLVAVSEGSAWGWVSGRILGLLAIAAASFVVWIAAESRSASPLIDIRVMREPAVFLTNLVALLFGAGMYASLAFLPEFLQTPHRVAGYGFSASITQSGLFVVPLPVGMSVVGAISGPLGDRIGHKMVLFIGAVASAIAYLLLAFAHHRSWEIYLESTIIGVAFGFGFSAMSTLIVQSVPPAQTGAASGMNANIRSIGGAVGSAVMAVIVTAVVGAHGLPRESGYTRGFLFLGLASLLAAATALFIPTTRLRAATEPMTDEGRAAVAGPFARLAPD